MPIEGPQPCPKSVKICPVGQKRVLKSGYGPLPKPRRERKGGRSSKSGRPRGRKLLSEDGEDALPPHVMRERCGPVYVCVPDVKPQCPKYRPPRCRRGQRISTTTLKNGCKKPICVNGKPTRPIPGPMPILFPKRQCGQRCNQYKCKPGRKCKRVFIPGYIQKDGKTCGKKKPRCSNVVKPQCPEYQRPRCKRGQKVISLRLKNGCKKPICVGKKKPCPRLRPPRCKRGQKVRLLRLKNGCKKLICVNGKPIVPAPKRRCGQRCNRNKCMPGRICTRVVIPGYIQKDGKTCGKQRPRCSNVVKPQCPDYQRPLCKRGQRISTTTLKNGYKKPICVNGKPTRPIPGPMPMPIEGPQPCPKSVKICPVGQKRVLKSGYGPLPKPRHERKGGRSSKSGRPRG